MGEGWAVLYGDGSLSRATTRAGALANAAQAGPGACAVRLVPLDVQVQGAVWGHTTRVVRRSEFEDWLRGCSATLTAEDALVSGSPATVYLTSSGEVAATAVHPFGPARGAYFIHREEA